MILNAGRKKRHRMKNDVSDSHPFKATYGPQAPLTYSIISSRWQFSTTANKKVQFLSSNSVTIIAVCSQILYIELKKHVEIHKLCQTTYHKCIASLMAEMTSVWHQWSSSSAVSVWYSEWGASRATTCRCVLMDWRVLKYLFRCATSLWFVVWFGISMHTVTNIKWDVIRCVEHERSWCCPSKCNIKLFLQWLSGLFGSDLNLKGNLWSFMCVLEVYQTCWKHL